MVNLDYTNTKLRRAQLAFDDIAEYKGILLPMENQSIKFNIKYLHTITTDNDLK